MPTTLSQIWSIFVTPQEKFSTEKFTEHGKSLSFYCCGLSRIELEETKRNERRKEQKFPQTCKPSREGTPPVFFILSYINASNAKHETTAATVVKPKLWLKNLRNFFIIVPNPGCNVVL